MSSREALGSDGVDPSLKAGAVLDPETFHGLLREFWLKDPTESWRPYLDQAASALNDGVPVLILSGRNGVGKTEIFGGQLERSRNDYYIDEGPNDPSADLYTAPRFSDYKIIHSDEATRNVAYYGAERFVNALDPAIRSGKQFITIFPAVSKSTRKLHVDSFQRELASRNIDFLNLGDVTEAHIAPDRVQQLLESMSVNQATIDVFNKVPALRTLRLFGGLINTAWLQGQFPQQLTTQWIESEIAYLAHPSRYERIFYRYNEVWSYLTADLPDHLPFMSQSISTDDSVGLYKAFGIPLPRHEEFAGKLTYDPYQKD